MLWILWRNQKLTEIKFSLSAKFDRKDDDLTNKTQTTGLETATIVFLKPGLTLHNNHDECGRITDAVKGLFFIKSRKFRCIFICFYRFTCVT